MPLVNPPARLLGTANAVVGGRGTRYEHRFAGPVSVKSVRSGRATWETAAGRFEVVPGSVLVLNDGEEYEITIDALQPVETFCLFFERGFVEDAWRASTGGSAELLDDAEPRPVFFSEKVHFDAALLAAVNGEPSDAAFYRVAIELVRAQAGFASRIARLPALKPSTREELARRIGVATAYLHANLDRNVLVGEAAREACLSPFHFHRLFSAFHGLTPHHYLTRLRLERARALLRASDQRVADVAVACGFESIGSFTTLFKRTYGVSPAAIRKNGKASGAAPALD